MYNNELDKLQQSIAVLKKSITSSMNSMPNDSSKDMMNHIYSMCDQIYSYASKIRDEMSQYRGDHSQGHLPPIIGADKMNKALDKLGLAGDYVVNPKVIHAGKNNVIIEAEYKSPK